MRSRDCYGNELMSHSAEVIEAIDHFSDQLLRLGPEATQILQVAQNHPEEFFLQVYAGMFHLFGQTEKSKAEAVEFLKNAEALQQNANEREKSFYRGVQLWEKDRLSDALLYFEGHCRDWQEDLVALKTTEFLYYCKGQQYQGARFLDLTGEAYSKWKNHPLFLSMHSFALELTGNYDNAEIEARRGVDLDPLNPWAHHTLGHVYINRGEIDQGIELLESFIPYWEQSGRLILSHNLWHLALLYLENLDFENCLKVYERADWKNKVNLVAEELDAASLLWRLDMEKQDVAKQWKELAEKIDGRAGFGSTPFVNVQLCYCLKRGGQEEKLQEALLSLERFTKVQKGEDQKVWSEVGLPLLKGSLAFADQDYKTALKYLEPIIDEVGCVGGSDAQVDLFRQTYLKSLIGVERRQDVKKFLSQLTHGRSLTPLELGWFNSVE